MSEVVRKLRPFAKMCGAEILNVTEVPRQYAAPFDEELGIDWDRGALLYTSRASRLGGLIHELGHFVIDGHKTSPWSLVGGTAAGAEYRFLGWEYAVAQKCKLAYHWIRAMKGYDISVGLDTRPWETFPLTSQMRVLNERLTVAESKGFIVNGEPVTQFAERE